MHRPGSRYRADIDAPAPPPLEPLAFLQLAGHPLRWRLLCELGRSDRRVHDLTALVGEPQSVVSYHLGRLRSAGLVSARRSSADRRDTWYALDLPRVRDLLAATGTALHPGLAPGAPGAGPAAGARVLFLCTGNSARSPMAAALTVARSGGAVAARSAGSHPKPLHPLAVRVLRDEHGIDISGHRPRHLREVAADRYDRVVTLCDRVREVCPELPGDPPAVHWSIPDPATAAAGGDAYLAFRRTAAELATRVDFLLADLSRPSGTEPVPA
ncbi:MAG: MarR family transcriptional regulator [Acidimicrobiia bacterium]